jgi:SAM-dependent methyltransferase
VLSLEEDTATVAAVTHILGRASSLNTTSASLTAEIADIQDRFFGGETFAHPPISPDANRTPRAGFERHYFPPSIARSERFSANVRVRNDGAHDWSSRTRHPLALKAQWLGQVDEPVFFTHFPVDVSPGRAITVPIKMVAPEKMGVSTVRVSLECVGTRGRASQHLDIPIDVGPACRDGEISNGIPQNPAIVDYAEDHRDALHFLLAYVEKWGKSRMRMLEVGSGPHPQLAWLDDSELVAIDISAPLLELGSLYFGQRFAHRLAFVCADAYDPPFAPGTFDLVAMFSTLHHFAEPETLLKRLSALLRVDGILAVMCEPVDDTISRTPIVRDLLKGINEQVFSVPEYLRIFAAADLTVLSMKVDGGSLKAILRKT